MTAIEKEIKALKERIWDQEKRMSQFYDALHDVSSSNIDFIAMETGVDLDMGENDEEVI